MKVLHNWYEKASKNVLFSKTLVPLYRTVKRIVMIPNEKKRYNAVSVLLAHRSINMNAVFYLGSPEHANLGDLAQGMCVREWINKHYSDYELIEIKTKEIVNTRYSSRNIVDLKQDIIHLCRELYSKLLANLFLEQELSFVEEFLLLYPLK